MTHFSDAGNPTIVKRQMSCFLRCHQSCSKACGVSVANSAGLLSRSDLHGDWVRPGIMLYGVNPLGPRVDVPLRTAMTLVARIVAIREIGADESVGYSAGWRSIRPSRIATVGIGYGDGYPRHAVNGTPVWAGGRIVPLAGYVSMDSLAIDITACEGIEVGDEVQLWGPDLPVSTVAAYANTIPYDLFTSLNSRVPRVYAT